MKSLIIVLSIVSLLFINKSNPDWITYISKDKSFKIKFPAQPVEQQMPPQFGTMGSLLIACSPEKGKDDNAIYWLNVTDFPPDKINSDLAKDVQDKFIKTQASSIIRMVGNVLSEENISINNFPGIYMKGEVTQRVTKEEEKGLIYVKVFLVKSKIYQLMTSCALEKKDNPSIKAFFDSFELLEK
jgi:hypothetical protein